MKNNIHLSDLISDSSMVDDYDPNAMSVEKAKAWIANFLNPIDQKETIHITLHIWRWCKVNGI